MSITASVYDDLVGQEHIVDVLQSAVAATRSGDEAIGITDQAMTCLLYTSPSPRDRTRSRMPSSA